MSDSTPISALQELVAGGFIAADPAAQPLPGGNADRRDRAVRTAWRVNLPDGRTARLLLAPRLADLAQRHRAFAAACPDLVPAPVFYQTLKNGEAWAESFFAGRSLESAASESPDETSAAFAQVGSRLATTSRPSTESARLAEWQTWTGAVESLPIWTPDEKQLLRDLIWPQLYPLLAVTPPVTRWTNGDFTSDNILVNERGQPQLIDSEFAGDTHFFAEDAVRFHALSPSAAKWPELYAASLPPRGPAWQLFFWLRQLTLESANNTAAYLARVRPGRLGVIRRLAEQVTRRQLVGWSVAAPTVHFHLETACWEQTPQTELRIAGWCHVPATAPSAIVATQDDVWLGQTTLTERPDVQAHFDDVLGARAAGFSLALPLPGPDAPIVLSARTPDGALLPFYSCQAGELPGRGPRVEDYTRWATLYDPDPAAPTGATPGPLFSILLPVFNPPPEFLRACLRSVQLQHYDRWEICLVDDGSTAAGVAAVLREFAAERRLRVQTLPTNGGIARATNAALAAARGEFIVLLDHDDILRPHALTEFALRLQQESSLDALYSDEDKITADGVRVASFLKPDFSPEYLLGVMYIGHALCVRTSVARTAGAFDPVYDGLQDFEFFLRLTEHTRRIGHIPRQLYHWRQSPGSSALHGNVKGDMDQKQADAVRAHLRRRGRSEEVTACGRHRVQLHATGAPSTELVRTTAPESWAAALRQAAGSSRAEVLIVVTVELQSMSEPERRELANLAARPDSAIVAPLLLAPNGLVWASGWTTGPTGSGPLMRGFDPAGDGYTGSLLCTREVAAVSPVCFALSRELLIAHPPHDEDWLTYSQTLRTGGRYHRVCSTVRVKLTCAPGGAAEQISSTTTPDPFFNPHFKAQSADYSLARPLAHSAPVLWHLDTPLAGVLPDGCVTLRGWCFAAKGDSIAAIRLCTADVTLFGVTGRPRSDVKADLPEAPGANTGFEIHGTLPSGRHRLALEAKLAEGTWVLLQATTVAVNHRFPPRWLGRASWTELMAFQFPLQASHPPVQPQLEKFPPIAARESRLKLAIVTPSYNQAQYLGETMRSVLTQRGVACEYVVQDGGSTDGSQALIAAMETGDRRLETGSEANISPAPVGHRPSEGLSGLRPQASRLPPPNAPRLIAWESAPDKGQADAIAKGFAKTSGGPDDLMGWINSDDFYLPGTLAFVADYFARHPEVDVLYGHRILVDESSQEISRWFLPKHDAEVLRLYDFVPQETLFWRRRIWDQVGGIDSRFKFAMDWDLLLRFQAAGAKLVRVPCFLACFRVHAAQKTSAQMHDVGQKEITLLRERTHGRPFPPQELESNPRLLRYLRRSAFIEWLWKLGLRAP